LVLGLLEIDAKRERRRRREERVFGFCDFSEKLAGCYHLFKSLTRILIYIFNKLGS